MPELKDGDYVFFNGERLKVTKAETNQNLDGSWPLDEWPRISFEAVKEPDTPNKNPFVKGEA